MSACPFCQSAMQPAPSGELPLETCGDCGAVWFEGDALAKVMGGAVSDALLRRAKDRPGSCKGCHGELQSVPECPHCSTRSPTCPRCGHAPLPVVEVFDVPLEVCSGCAGVALDAGELQQLQAAVSTYRNAPLDLRPTVRIEGKPCCAACRRDMLPAHGFVWEEALYCGSCAPSGATPFTEEMDSGKGVPLIVPSRRGPVVNVGGFVSAGMIWLLKQLTSGSGPTYRF
ncbi:TFIIB-type zinc ribbon-containing protein [Myxococcus vastator]|uniref:TFIIB-type zinc ribbon-containing protein n=1 Tax=Myxococcus vastator TaxID=2709664 RepID=UPI0013D02D29|nr:zf-TFIIB domain-containing protein [Myxococcus vastator]